LNFDISTNRFIPLITIEEAVGMATKLQIPPYDVEELAEWEKALHKLNPDIQNGIIQLQKVVMKKYNELFTVIDKRLNEIEKYATPEIADLRDEIQKMIYDNYDGLKEAWRADLPNLNKKIDEYRSEMRSFERKFEKKNEEANKLLEQHEKIQKLINEATPFEKEIAKLKTKSEEWSIFRGYASRHLKGKQKEEYKLPHLFCPVCSEPTTEEDGDYVDVIFPMALKEKKADLELVFPNSWDKNMHLYRENHFLIPISLWNQCEKKEHKIWHQRHMRKTRDYLGEKEIMPHSSEKTNGEDNLLKPRIDDIDNWFEDLAHNNKLKYGKKKITGLMRNYATIFFENPDKFFDIIEPAKILKKNGTDAPEESTCYDYKTKLEAINAISKGKGKNEGKYTLKK